MTDAMAEMVGFLALFYMASVVCFQVLGWLFLVPDEHLNDWCDDHLLSALIVIVWPVVLVPHFWVAFERRTWRRLIKQRIKETAANGRRRVLEERRKQIERALDL